MNLFMLILIVGGFNPEVLMNDYICKGALALGTGCKSCSKCFKELESVLKFLPETLKDLSGCENTAGINAAIELVEDIILERRL